MTSAETTQEAIATAVLRMRDYAGGSIPTFFPDVLTPTARQMLDDNRLLNLCKPAEQFGLDSHREAIWSMNAPALYTIAQLSRRFSADEIPHVVIKSPLLTHDLHGDYFFRMSTDVDILVAASDRARAIRGLDGLGFKINAACRTLYWRTFMGEQHFESEQPDFLTVDLHTTIRHPAGYAPDLTRGILAGRIMAALGDGHVPVPNSRDAFLLAAVYLLKAVLKYEPAGSHLLDLAVMHRRLDAQDVRAITSLASARGLKRTTAFARGAVTALLAPEIGTVSPDAGPLDRALGEGDLWTRLLAPSEAGPLQRARCVAVSCDRASDSIRAIGWEIGRKLAQKAAHAGIF